MAIQDIDNRDYRGKKPNFVRDSFDTISQMKSWPETDIDEGHISVCQEDGYHYEFKSGNQSDPSTGKWRRFPQVEDNLSSESSDASLSAKMGNSLQTRISEVESAQQQKDEELKELIDAKVIEAGGVSFDTAPTQSSTNPVTSGGLFTNNQNRDSNTGISEYGQFSSGTSYSAGTIVFYQNLLYKFTQEHPAGDWTPGHVERTSFKKEIESKLAELSSNVEYFLRAYGSGSIVNTIESHKINEAGDISKDDNYRIVVYSCNKSLLLTWAYDSRINRDFVYACLTRDVDLSGPKKQTFSLNKNITANEFVKVINWNRYDYLAVCVPIGSNIISMLQYSSRINKLEEKDTEIDEKINDLETFKTNIYCQNYIGDWYNALVHNWNADCMQRNVKNNLFGKLMPTTRIVVPNSSYNNRNQFEIRFRDENGSIPNFSGARKLNINLFIFVNLDCSLNLTKYDTTNSISDVNLIFGKNLRKGINRVVVSCNLSKDISSEVTTSVVFNTDLPEDSEIYILDHPIIYAGMPVSNIPDIHFVDLYKNHINYPLDFKPYGLSGFSFEKYNNGYKCTIEQGVTGWTGFSIITEDNYILDDEEYFVVLDIEILKNVYTEGSTSEAGNNYWRIKKYTKGEGYLTSIVTGTRTLAYATVPKGEVIDANFKNRILLQTEYIANPSNEGDIEFILYDFFICKKNECKYDNIQDLKSDISANGFERLKLISDSYKARKAEFAEVAKRVLSSSSEDKADIDLTGDSLVAQGWGDYLSQELGGRKVYSHGFGGKKSTYIRDQFLSYLNKERVQIIDVGRNNFNNIDTVIDDIRRMVDAYGNNKFLILMPPNGNYGTFGSDGNDGTGEMKGGGNYNYFIELSDKLSKEYGSNFFDTREASIYGWWNQCSVELLASFTQPEIGGTVKINVSDANFLTSYNSSDVSAFGEEFMSHIRIGLNGKYDKYKVVSKDDDTHLTVQLVEVNYIQPGSLVNNLTDNGGTSSVIYLKVVQECDYQCYIYDTTLSTFRSDRIHRSEKGKKYYAKLVARKVLTMNL